MLGTKPWSCVFNHFHLRGNEDGEACGLEQNTTIVRAESIALDHAGQVYPPICNKYNA